MQGGIGHKVKRKVRLEQMTCVLLMGDRERGRGEGEEAILLYLCPRSEKSVTGTATNRVRVSISLSPPIRMLLCTAGVYFHDMR